MFTTQEAVSFLQDKWGMQRVQELSQDVGSRKDLLEELIKLSHSKLSFQNVALMSVPLTERKLPDLATIKEECMAGAGGLCYSINVFVWGLLKSLGFSANLCSASVRYPGDHTLVLVNDLEKQGDLHLVDCGCGIPTFRAVSLDFESESPVFVESFLEYKFIRHDGKVLRMHGKGDPLEHQRDGVYTDGKWGMFYSFFPYPSDVAVSVGKVYTTPSVSPFHYVLVAMAFPDQHVVKLANNRLRVEKEDGEMETTVLEGDEAIVDSYRRYFPSLQEERVRNALHQWHMVKHQGSHTDV